MMKSIRLVLLFGFLLGLGCGDPNEAVVSGTVTVDGEPAKMGSITFIPVDGETGTAGGAITDGKYTAEVPIGTKKVQIRVSRIVGQTKLYDTPDSPMQPVYEEVLPPKYNDQTELILDVKPGQNEENYDLSAKQS